ncbi:MAG TPA: hypothetical protein VF101_01420 [Gaiellaceae bacterium]
MAVALAAAAAASAGAVVANAVLADDPPPAGVSAGVSSLVRLPPVSALPRPVARFVEVSARARATDPEGAKRRVRRLRSDLGTTHADVYAFANSAGAPCFILVDEVGLCPARPTDGSPGLQWTIGGGYPGSPSNLVGIASDDVVSVDLSVDGTSVPVSLRNNVVFGEYPSKGRHAEITINRRDGSRGKVQVNLEPAGQGFADLRYLRQRALEEARTRARARAQP